MPGVFTRVAKQTRCPDGKRDRRPKGRIILKEKERSMALLLETTFGDLVIDLDIDGSPALCKNILKLAKARYYTNTLVYNVVQGRFCQCGDPRGDGTGGCSIYGLIDSIRQTTASTTTDTGTNSSSSSPLSKVTIGDVTTSTKRFLKSSGRELSTWELKQKGVVAAVEMGGAGVVKDTVGSQFMITVDGNGREEGRGLHGLVYTTAEEGEENRHGRQGNDDNDDDPNNGGRRRGYYLSLGVVTEDDNDVLGKINATYCDKEGRPYADVRIIRALVIDDPFEDPMGMDLVMKARGVELDENDGGGIGAVHHRVIASPDYDRPPEEYVEIRIGAHEALAEEEAEDGKREEELKKKEDRSRAVVLEMLGDLPSADVKAPENVLFVCKLNPVTDDEDLELIFSRFDPEAKAEIIRDPDTGDSLCYAFVEFTTKEQCNEAYFKMNSALVDDRRIKVDFSQSVAKEWNKYTQRRRGGGSGRGAGTVRGGGGFGQRGGRFGGRGGGRDRRDYDQRREAYVSSQGTSNKSNNAPIGEEKKARRSRWGSIAANGSSGLSRERDETSDGNVQDKDEYGESRRRCRRSESRTTENSRSRSRSRSASSSRSSSRSHSSERRRRRRRKKEHKRRRKQSSRQKHNRKEDDKDRHHRHRHQHRHHRDHDRHPKEKWEESGEVASARESSRYDTHDDENKRQKRRSSSRHSRSRSRDRARPRRHRSRS